MSKTKEKLVTWRIQAVGSIVIQLPEGVPPESLSNYDITDLVKSRRCKEVTIGVVDPYHDIQMLLNPPFRDYTTAAWGEKGDHDE